MGDFLKAKHLMEVNDVDKLIQYYNYYLCRLSI